MIKEKTVINSTVMSLSWLQHCPWH